MEEELLKLIEQMEAAGASEEAIADAVYQFEQQSKQPEPQTVTEPVKKKDGTGNGEGTPSSSSETEENSTIYDMWNSLKAGTKRALSGIAGIPNAAAKFALSTVAPKEFDDYINSLNPDQREAFIYAIAGSQNAPGSMSAASMEIAESGSEKQEELLASAKADRERMTQYENSITEDLFVKRDFAQAGKRLAVEGVGSIPSILQTLIPVVGLTSVGMGEAANKQEEIEEEGGDISIASTSNAAISGTAEALFEKYTQGKAKEMIKALKGAGDKAVYEGIGGFVKGIREIAKGALGEGASELGTGATQKIADLVILGKEQEAEEAMLELADQFLVGMAVGGPMKGSTVISNALVDASGRQAAGKKTKTIPSTQPIGIANTIEETAVYQKVQDARNAGKTDEQILKEFKDQDAKTAEILIQREADQLVDEKQAYEKSREEAQKAREKATTPEKRELTKFERAIVKAGNALTDRQTKARRVLNKSGFKETVDYMVTRLGASAYAKHLANKAHKLTFDRLTKADVRNLEEIILNKRIIAIDKNRADRGMNPKLHQGGMTGISAQKALDGYRTELGAKKFAELERRADNYFDAYRGLLKTMKDEELITQETYDLFAEVDYQPTQFLQFLEDMDGNFLAEELDQFEGSGLTAEQIKSFKGGSTGSQFMDSQTMLQRSILVRSKAVFVNRMNRSLANEFQPAMRRLAQLEVKENLTKAEQKQLRHLKELRNNVIMDEIVGFTKSGKPKYRLSETGKKGWSPVYYFKDGVRHRMFLKDSFHQSFTDTNNQILNATTREAISKGTGTRLIKSFATGNNPLFFITNIPRDLAFVLAFSKEYGTGPTTFVPSQIPKLIADFAKGSKSALMMDEVYDQYIKYGGGMDFLTLQGRYGKEGIFFRDNSKIADKIYDIKNVGIGRRVKDVMDAIRRFNTASEFATRIALFQRSIKNQLKERNVKDINTLDKAEQDLIYTRAVRSAREITDFNQGGKASKALDSALPYFNAAVQGTRSAVENFKTRPLETSSRILQIGGAFAAMSTTAAIAIISSIKDEDDEEIAKMSNEEIYFETLKAVSPYDLRNYYIYPLGKKDAKGNWRYVRIAKSQTLSPFLNMAEHYVRDFYAKQAGIEYKQDLGKEMYETVNLNILPVSLNPMDAATRIPIVDAAFAWSGIDSYTGNPLDWDKGKIPDQLEGLVDDRVEGFYKDLGEKLEIGPARLKAVTESFLTTPSTNPYIGFAYAGADYISTGEKKDIVDNFLKAAGKRVYKTTSEYNVISKAKERVSKEVVDAYRKHMLVEKAVRDAVRQSKKKEDPKYIDEVLEKTFKNNPELLEKSLSWAKSEIKKKKLAPFVNTLRFEENKEVRAILLAERFGDSLLKEDPAFGEREKRIVEQLVKEKALDKDTYRFYKALFD